MGDRAPFIAAASLAGVNFVYGLTVFPETLPPGRRRAFSWARANPLGALATRAAAAAASRPFAEAFTGAVARRDTGTVRRHVAALASYPETLALYRALAEEALRRTAPAGKEDEIRRILRGEQPGS